jgi:hypothetical protein
MQSTRRFIEAEFVFLRDIAPSRASSAPMVVLVTPRCGKQFPN